MVSRDWLAHPTLSPALLYGVDTVAFPYFIVQPALGLGIVASRTPHPTYARSKSLMTHSVFGLGLYSCALGISHLLRSQSARSPTGRGGACLRPRGPSARRRIPVAVTTHVHDRGSELSIVRGVP